MTSNAFTIYWTPGGWEAIGVGNTIGVAGGSGFLGRVVAGSRIFVTNVYRGELRLVGAFTVKAVYDRTREGKPSGASWDAPEYLLAAEGSSSPVLPTVLPTPLVKSLRFLTRSAKESGVKFDSNGQVNGQAMRAVRQLTPESALLLERLIEQQTVTIRRGATEHAERSDTDSMESQTTATGRNQRGASRLAASELSKVTPEHIDRAIRRMLSSPGEHPFGESTDYDVVLEDGVRLPPKAVFGLAATEALGFQVEPKHFTAGINSHCFRALGAAGLDIQPKGEVAEVDGPPHAKDQDWSEGTPRLRQHLSRERSSGLREAKKAEFRRVHGGRLFCERCQEDPVEKYGTEHAEACIEVHHKSTHVAAMEAGHRTRLEDLECLCANCHRLEHRLLRASA